MDDPSQQHRFPNLRRLGDATPHVGRIFDIIEHIRLFEDFERAEIAVLASYMSCYRAGAGAEIIREGDQGDFMFLMLEGTVEILKLDPDSNLPVRVGVAGPGRILGEMSLVDGEPRFASCVAAESCLFAALDRDALSRIITDQPTIGIKVLMQLVMLLNQRLRDVSNALMRCLGKVRQSSEIAP